jgi:septum site-determining protein MinC
MARAAPFTIRGSHFNMVTLQLREGSPDIVLPALRQLLNQSPAFLRDSPVVIGLDELPKGSGPIDFAGLVEGLRALKLIPVGAAGGAASLRQAAAAAGLAQFTKGQQLFKSDNGARGEVEPPPPPPPASIPETSVESPPTVPEAKSESASGVPQSAMVVSAPVRAGSRIYAQGRDIICMATVNPGAEVIADGHVHVYGTLRGRAIAGASGFEGARIFALNFDPELVAIAGLYRVRDVLDASMIGSKVQVSLQGEEMRLDPLG